MINIHGILQRNSRAFIREEKSTFADHHQIRPVTTKPSKRKKRTTTSPKIVTVDWNTLVEQTFDDLILYCPWTIFVGDTHTQFAITYIRWTWHNNFRAESDKNKNEIYQLEV